LQSGEICYYFHGIFKFASSLGRFDTFSLAGYSDMKSKLVTSLR
jgi:ubiquinone/menaquinone biosynthesis C-methylase UbiE